MDFFQKFQVSILSVVEVQVRCMASESCDFGGCVGHTAAVIKGDN